MTVEEIRKLEADKAFQQDVEKLHNKIKANISKLENQNKHKLDPTQIEVNNFLIKEYKKLLTLNTKTRWKLDYVNWRYNGGALRTEEEIIKEEKRISDKLFLESGNFEKDCMFTTLATFGIGFIGAFILTLNATSNDGGVAIILLALPFMCIAGFITSIIGHAINISEAKSHNVPKTHPQVIKEGVGLATCIIAGTSFLRHTKKAVKDITNVDGWKEMK